MLVRLRRLSGVAGLALLVVLFSAPVGLVQAALVWQIETVDAAGDVGVHSSLALDSNGQPHISYYDESNGNLKYAAFDGAAWVTETVDAAENTGWYTSLALDSNGQPRISYYDAFNQDLKYAAFDGSDWQIETVDVLENVGTFTSLSFDSNGHPHISYFAISNFDLKYATFDGSNWQISTVDAAGVVGEHTSLALDSNGQPHISYLDGTNQDLMYASFDGSNWQIATIDAAGFVGGDTSLALDSENQPHISYRDSSNASLKYAAFDGSDWQIATVDAAGSIGGDTALALDSENQPHISYADGTNDDLKYASFDGSNWQIATVDAAGTVGHFNSLALDDTGQPHISYDDTSNGTLKYAQVALNQPPTVDAGDPYSGTEGSAISLDATVTDPESDGLTTGWSYTIDDADSGTSCTFGDASQVDTTFTCTDDGTFTVTLTADDGLNPPVTDTATVTLSNAAPTTDATATITRAGATITVAATDPGQNDTLSYAFDCDADGSYEVDAGAMSSTTCALNPQQEGSFTFGIQVSDDDGGVTTDTATVTIATEMCSNTYTGVLRYGAPCRDYETAVTIPDLNGPVTVCASKHNGLLRSPSNGACAGHETSYVLPEDGPLSVCVSVYTQTMRVVDNVGQCTGHEFGRVIAATEIGETRPPR